jgi:hypothetical protein
MKMNHLANRLSFMQRITKYIVLLPSIAAALVACGTIAKGGQIEQIPSGPVITVRGEFVIFDTSYFKTEDGRFYDLRLINKDDQQLIMRLSNSPQGRYMKCFVLTVIGIADTKQRPDDHPFFFASHIVRIKKTKCPSF